MPTHSSLLRCTVSALCLVLGAAAQAQAVFSPETNQVLIPQVTVGGQPAYVNVVLRLDGDGRFTLVAAQQAPVAGGAQTLALQYAPQDNTQYWYNAQGQRQVAVCSALPVAQITLKVPAQASAQAKVPLVIALAGWAPNGNPPAPVSQDTDLADRLANAGLASASLEYRGCDNWSSPLIARTRVDESFDIDSADFGLALAALKQAVAQNNLPVDTSRIVVAGTSFSSNLIYTVATQHRVQGAIAINGGCDYSCQMTGTTYAQPNDFRVNGQAIRVGAASGALDTLFPPDRLGDSGYGANAARTRILAAVADPAKRPAAFYTYVDPQAGHNRTDAMVAKVVSWAQCMTGVRAAADCAADDR